ncbi:asparaginase [Haloarcula sediminis]|uniref:asparaginase n=1 Tax=Haloarcula sediminis TaxID=3111777 RepID=UPI002D777BAC|nr:asparaginase [Haloarcula sp. CK38]
MTVTIVSTGGTIASTENTGGDASPELSSSDLVAAVPTLEDIADIETSDFSNVPSAQFTVEQMGALVDHLHNLDSDPSVDGIVVTQGTDILEESSYFVDLCYDGATPVVFTGAMRNPSLPSPDGPANLLASVRATQAPQATGSVLVAFNDRIHAAREVTKTNSMNVDTFRSPEFGPLAVIEEDRVVWRRTPTGVDPSVVVNYEDLTSNIHAVTVTADMPPAQIEAAQESNGLCLAATGAGHIPPRIIPALEDIVEAGVPIVATTRCPEGRLARNSYEFEGSETTLQDLGCYYSDLNLQKTRIRTIVAIGADRFEALFERPTQSD